MGTTAAVIGGGAFGLMALKNLLEAGFDVTLYEGRSYVGGIWKASDDDSPSAAETTIFQSSKVRSAISDFPTSDDMDVFPTTAQLHKYLEAYCDQFNLWPSINLNTHVHLVKRSEDHWLIDIESKSRGRETVVFDKVVFCCGPFVQPKRPKVTGLETFRGKIIHSKDFYNAADFKGKRILIIGLHATASDVIAALAGHATKCFASHRTGLVMIPRYLDDGATYDQNPGLGALIPMFYLSALWPTLFNWILDWFLGGLSKKAYPNVPASWGFSPAPSLAASTPLIATEIYPHLVSGFAEPVPEVTKIDRNNVTLKSGRVLTDIDAIIYCTGYHATIPVKIEPAELNPYPYPGALPNLYRHIFPMHPDPKIRTSLAFLGQGAAPFPGFAPHEMQGVALGQVWQGKSSLPSFEGIQAWRRQYLDWRHWVEQKYQPKTGFYTHFLPMEDHFAWLDKEAGVGIREHFGLFRRWTSWRAWSFWWNDPELYKLCLTGVTSPAIFRLFDMGKRKAWSGARAQILKDNERTKELQKQNAAWLRKLG